MSSLNQCNFIGRVGKIESRSMTNGEQVVNLSLAVDDSYKDKSGNKVDQTEWVNITIYRKLAEITDRYVQKGQQLFISGKLKTRKYTNQQGIERYTTDIIASDMKMLGSKPEGQETRQEPRQSAQKQAASGFDDFESDVPF